MRIHRKRNAAEEEEEEEEENDIAIARGSLKRETGKTRENRPETNFSVARV